MFLWSLKTTFTIVYKVNVITFQIETLNFGPLHCLHYLIARKKEKDGLEIKRQRQTRNCDIPFFSFIILSF